VFLYFNENSSFDPLVCIRETKRSSIYSTCTVGAMNYIIHAQFPVNFLRFVLPVLC